MLTICEQERIIEEIATILRDSERFNEQDLCNKFALAGPDRKLIWKARELVRRDGVVFGVIPKWPGNFRRLDWQQTANQAVRQRAAGTRKHRRAGEKLRLAASQAPDEAKEKLNDAADRVALRLAMQAAKRVG